MSDFDDMNYPLVTILVCLCAILFYVGVLVGEAQADTQPAHISIFSQCPIQDPVAVIAGKRLSTVYGYTEPNVFDHLLQLTGTPLSWSPDTGFDYGDAGRYVGSVKDVIIVVTDIEIIRMLVTQRGDSLFLYMGDDSLEYVAPYGGSKSWHVTCGAYRIDKAQYDAFWRALDFITTSI